MKKSIILIVLFVLSIRISHAQEEKYIGLFVYNFTKYFDWPESTKDRDFEIFVLGHKSVFDELCKITNGKSVGSQQIVVKHITTPGQVEDNQILFLGHWQTRHLEAIKTKIQGKPILLITEFEGLINKGSTINFVIRNGSIKFQLNETNADMAGLQTDPRIKQLAHEVVQ